MLVGIALKGGGKKVSAPNCSKAKQNKIKINKSDFIHIYRLKKKEYDI